MPALAALSYANGKVPKIDIKPEQALILAALAIAGGALLFAGARRVPGGVQVPAAQTENIKPFTPPSGAPVVGPDQHLGGVVYTPHRYPRVAGHEITALINYGHATLKLPHARDIDWLTAPPGEDTL
jgi:hypothetical protein